MEWRYRERPACSILLGNWLPKKLQGSWGAIVRLSWASSTPRTVRLCICRQCHQNRRCLVIAQRVQSTCRFSTNPLITSFVRGNVLWRVATPGLSSEVRVIEQATLVSSSWRCARGVVAPPPPSPLRVVSCGLAWPPSVCHQNSSGTGRCRYAGSLWPFTMASREYQGRLGCGDEFLEGVGEVTEVHLLSPWGAISAPPTDRAAGAEVDKMATWELTRPLPASGQKSGSCFAVPLALQMSLTGQLALRTRRQHTA